MFLILNFCFYFQLLSAQNVEILNYTVNNFGQVELEIEANADEYYLLSTTHQPSLNYQSVTSMTMGVDGSMIISEPLSAFPQGNYSISAHPIDDPGDYDGDGKDDISEFNNMPSLSPLNFAREVPSLDGVTAINNSQTFSDLSVVSTDIPWAPFLNNQEFVKFAIVNQDSENPEIYFINSVTHPIHNSFLNTINLDLYQDDVVTGEIVYNPNEIFYNGAIGSYSFNFSFGLTYDFDHVRRTFELLAANMPFLNNNLQHFIGADGENNYENIYKDDYIGSRIPVVLESILFQDIDFIPFNQAEGYGFFRLMSLDDNPGSRDVVLYESIPNSLPRVGGIITSVIQTPLSHVNLRAIQDNVPNAYIANPLEIDSIGNLIDKYIYYKVESDKYTIREATLEEVNAWYENIRPTEPQIPERDLSQTEILPLDEIEFDMSTSFGAKCTNVATMRKFGFPEGTIPDGFGIPFYYYDEFMKFNGFYDKAQTIIEDPLFISDLEVRIEMLKEFRKDIKAADMPQWMLDDLQEMHESFPDSTSIRCRSSTNNEDLPGFSGAGLYTSKTQHPDEGHISKSIKQVYASMWNFRAFDERDFYRVDQYIAAMGVLCHPNYKEEKSNGVGISLDPIYQTDNTFYLNTQVGESLITNPDANSIPEELLLNRDPDLGYFVLRNSNLVPNGQLVMGEEYLNQMRDYLSVIHHEFEVLYNVVGAEGFGMDIEYKVTKDDQLIIKQARPWVSFWADINANMDLAASEITAPQNSAGLGTDELVIAKISNVGLREMSDFEIKLLIEDQEVETMMINDILNPQNSAEYEFTIPQDFSTIGDYNLKLIVAHPTDGYSMNDTLTHLVSKLHLLEGGVTASLKQISCGDELEAIATIVNYGESTFTQTEIEVKVNDIAVDTVFYNFNIPYQSEVDITITINENLQLIGNHIQLNLLKLNGEVDAISSNNSSSFNVDLESTNELISLVINADEWPQETSWQIIDINSNNIVDFGSLNQGEESQVTEICINYEECYDITIFDSYGDGICCAFGLGNISIFNNQGELILFNDGMFGAEVTETFCPSEIDCNIEASFTVTNASSPTSTDGAITINATGGSLPYEYSLDGGISFNSNNFFGDLSPGVYIIVIADSEGLCTYEEEVEVFGPTSTQNHLLNNNIKLFPNPTTGTFEIKLEENISWPEDIHLEIYNSLGNLIKVSDISQYKSRTLVSLNKEPSGTYFIKCYSREFEQYFKMIKI